jgi:hypothetical protein
VNRKDQKQLETIRRGQVDTAEQVAKSQEAINESWAWLQPSDRVEVAQKPRIRRREGRGPRRASRKKTL